MIFTCPKSIVFVPNYFQWGPCLLIFGVANHKCLCPIFHWSLSKLRPSPRGTCNRPTARPGTTIIPDRSEGKFLDLGFCSTSFACLRGWKGAILSFMISVPWSSCNKPHNTDFGATFVLFRLVVVVLGEEKRGTTHPDVVDPVLLVGVVFRSSPVVAHSQSPLLLSRLPHPPVPISSLMTSTQQQYTSSIVLSIPGHPCHSI